MPTHMSRRGTSYAFRRGVPKALREIVGKCEFKESLGKDYRAACRKVALLTVESDRELTQARQKLSAKNSTGDALDRYIDQHAVRRLKPLTELPPGLASAVSSLWLSELTNDAEQRRGEGLTDDQYDELDQNISEMRPVIARALATGQVEPFYPAVSNLLICRGYLPRLPESDMRTFTYDVLRAFQTGYQILAERQQGNLVAPITEVEPLAAVWEQEPSNPGKKSGEGSQWQALFEHWRKDRTRDSKIVYEVSRMWGQFTEYADSQKLGPESMTRAHVTEFLRHLREARGNKAATLKKKGGLLAAIFAVSVDDQLITNNPFSGYKYRRLEQKIGLDDDNEERDPFTLDDLRKIHGPDGPLYVQSSSGGGRKARYWMAMLALFSGARIDELAQLTAESVIVEPTPAYRIGRAKNEASLRHVPLHQVLVELGFLDFVRSIRSGPLFPLLYETEEERKQRELAQESGDFKAQSKKCDKFGKWFNRQLRRLGMGSSKVYHSYRHTFKDLCRDADIEGPLHDAITGHVSNKNTGDNYGRGYSLDTKVRAMAKIQIPIEFHKLSS